MTYYYNDIIIINIFVSNSQQIMYSKPHTNKVGISNENWLCLLWSLPIVCLLNIKLHLINVHNHAKYARTMSRLKPKRIHCRQRICFEQAMCLRKSVIKYLHNTWFPFLKVTFMILLSIANLDNNKK